MEVNNDISSKIIGHHGIVAGIAKKIKIVERIDSKIIKKAHNSKVTHGQVVLALIINGLGFQHRRLYFVSSFFKNLPVEELIGTGIKAEDLNDDVIGEMAYSPVGKYYYDYVQN